MDETKADWRTRIVESFHVVLLGVGALLFVFGITGGGEIKGLRLSIASLVGQYICAGVGFALNGLRRRPWCVAVWSTRYAAH
jgi:hypothetical protein